MLNRFNIRRPEFGTQEASLESAASLESFLHRRMERVTEYCKLEWKQFKFIYSSSCSTIPALLVNLLSCFHSTCKDMPKDNVLDDLFTNDDFSNVDLPLVIDTEHQIM